MRLEQLFFQFLLQLVRGSPLFPLKTTGLCTLDLSLVFSLANGNESQAWWSFAILVQHKRGLISCFLITYILNNTLQHGARPFLHRGNRWRGWCSSQPGWMWSWSSWRSLFRAVFSDALDNCGLKPPPQKWLPRTLSKPRVISLGWREGISEQFTF